MTFRTREKDKDSADLRRANCRGSYRYESVLVGGVFARYGMKIVRRRKSRFRFSDSCTNATMGQKSKSIYWRKARFVRSVRPTCSLCIRPMSRIHTTDARRIRVDPKGLEALGVASDHDAIGLGRSGNAQVALADIEENSLGLALEGIPVAPTAR